MKYNPQYHKDIHCISDISKMDTYFNLHDISGYKNSMMSVYDNISRDALSYYKNNNYKYMSKHSSRGALCIPIIGRRSGKLSWYFYKEYQIDYDD